MLFAIGVAPLAGAWIEMDPYWSYAILSHVAPLAGAWIEIYYIMVIDNLRCVAPLAGAWIEISVGENLKLLKGGRSPRGSVD